MVSNKLSGRFIQLNARALQFGKNSGSASGGIYSRVLYGSDTYTRNATVLPIRFRRVIANFYHLSLRIMNNCSAVHLLQ